MKITHMKKKQKTQAANYNSAERDDKLQFEGVIEEALPGTWFKVLLENTAEPVFVLATLSGKMRQSHIHVLPGDRVTVEVSPYDTSRGRICWRK